MPSERDSLPPNEARNTERNTERRLMASAPSPSGTDSSRDAAQDDFLFHLYRGAELLQESRVLEAKEELEHALMLQPKDAKGQDLLAATYFRIGLYPRAIAIYENLERLFPKDSAIKINLALCFLKTAQFEAARAALSDVVRANAAHKRAWGYLGVVHERMGDLENAIAAFDRGGHAAMAKRLHDRRTRATVPGPPLPRAGLEDAPLQGDATEGAFEEIDGSDLAFVMAEPGTAPSQGWHSVELGVVIPRDAPKLAKTLAPPSFHRPELALQLAAEAMASNEPRLPAQGDPTTATTVAPPPAHMLAESPPAEGMPPADLDAAVKAALLRFPRESAVTLHPGGSVLLRLDGAAPEFALRLEAMRLARGALATSLITRRVRGKDTTDVLGGHASPLVKVSVKVSASDGAELVLAPRAGHVLVPLDLGDELAYVREDVLLGFDLRLAHESGRLTADEGDPTHVLQLKGTGTFILELFAHFTSLDVTADKNVLVRRDALLGWTGRLLPRAVPSTEAPAGHRGLVAFSGEGMLLLTGR